MATEELPLVQLHDDFYRDSFGKVIIILSGLGLALALIASLSLYLYLSKPPPVSFAVDKDWRVQPPVPLNKPYLTQPEVLQWLANVMSTVFVFDFISYNTQLTSYQSYFTTDGWKVFLNQLNIHVNYNNVQTNRQFVNGVPAGAPSIINQGLLSGRYGWWMQMPVIINYVSYSKSYTQTLTLQVLIVRVSTLNNLDGVAIDNIIVANPSTRG